MERLDIYENIGRRTGGDIYIGVVGPVRSGKSTFIKRFSDLLILPQIKDVYERQRLIDEMPQSGSGKTITTTEPKFIPAEAAHLSIENKMSLNVKLVDCVGYMVPGAVGHMEENRVRMVATPWNDEKIPFEEAAQIGTEKVIKEHSTIGIVITTDGTIGTMPRKNYIEAEEKVISQLLKINKPFIIIMNSIEPDGSNAKKAAEAVSEKFNVPVIPMDCARADEKEISDMMAVLLSRFPVREVIMKIPGYLEGLDNSHWLKQTLINSIRQWATSFDTVDDIKSSLKDIKEADTIENAYIDKVDMGRGEVVLQLDLPEVLYYKILSEFMGEEIADDTVFFKLIKEYADAKTKYDRLKNAVAQVEECGYGIVEPKLKEMTLQEPEVFKQGGKFGVKIYAKAPTLHIIKTDITTEVSPVVGSEKQAEDLADRLKTEMNEAPDKIWKTNIFGKTLYDMVEEQMENKIASVPDNVRGKMQKSLQKISDEGKEYFICIII